MLLMIEGSSAWKTLAGSIVTVLPPSLVTMRSTLAKNMTMMATDDQRAERMHGELGRKRLVGLADRGDLRLEPTHALERIGAGGGFR